jgi:outer membrane protein TolC
MRIEASEPLRPAGSLDEWLAKAKQHNPELQLARTKLALAELEVTKTQAAHDPTLDLVAQRSLSKSENTQSPNASYRSSQVGVQLNVPLYAGGGVQSAVRQAVANREREQFVVAQASNDLALKVQREYHALAEGPERLQAARQALRSASQLVFSTSKGIQAGTRTVVDQLNAVQREAETRRELALVHYQLQLAWLKLAALSGEELQASVDEVNRQLQAQP